MCEICGGRGYVFNEKGKIVQCECIFKAQLAAYIQPLKPYLSSTAKGKTAAELEDRSQAIEKSDETVLGLMKYVTTKWYPRTYRITSPEECNEIGYNRSREYKSIGDLAYSFDCFVLDMSYINKVRAKKEGYLDYDTMFVLDLVKEVMYQRQSKVIVITDRKN